ncbi:hypothetical protein P154DRAFT_268209 [Amniculicola lignicola CBS 123094]|uniref:RRM domain-containing protein n=1 Tax=Amniculicola lignicola CBS 123094 TaxID=1392246 RepID=A0A6A5W8K7_9PLEO|nr:hypothetical protein P154DRAFT_268209 [Amniculicola lignicola CBS 123094]
MSQRLPPYSPSPSLFITNVADKIRKDVLLRDLYLLFATYGVVLDVVALLAGKMRGQAHVVFRNIDESTQALRALQGFSFHGKDLRITYAKGKSTKIAKLDGTFKIPAKEPEPGAEGQTAAQHAFGSSAPAPAKLAPIQQKPKETEPAKGVKRGREDESEEEEEEEEGSDDEEAAMDVSDSDDD